MRARLSLLSIWLSLPATGLAQDEAPRVVAVSGLVFSHFAVDLSADAATDFDIDRAYLTLKTPIGQDFGVRVTTDVGRIDDEGKLVVFLKYAYAEWKEALPGTTLRLGAAAMPFPGAYDSFWQHRYVAKSFTDANNLLSTSDFGLHALGEGGGGLIDWQLSLVNGEGHGSPEGDSDKALVTRATVDPLNKRDGHSLPITFTASQDLLGEKPRTLYGGAIGFANATTQVWMEYIGTLQADVHGSGTSATAVQAVGPIAVFARYDFMDADRQIDDDSTTTLLGGLSVELEAGIDLALCFTQEITDTETSREISIRTQTKF